MVNPRTFDLHRMYQRMETFPQSHKLFRAPSFLQKTQEYLDCSSENERISDLLQLANHFVAFDLIFSMNEIVFHLIYYSELA